MSWCDGGAGLLREGLAVDGGGRPVEARGVEQVKVSKKKGQVITRVGSFLACFFLESSLGSARNLVILKKGTVVVRGEPMRS